MYGGIITKGIYELFIKDTGAEIVFWTALILFLVSIILWWVVESNKTKFKKIKISKRVLFVFVSFSMSTLIFIILYGKYTSILPNRIDLTSDKTKVAGYSNSQESFNHVRDLYNHAFDQSLTFSIVSFVLIILVLEYLSRDRKL